jgi:two-component system, NtrC family, response regulator HydG
MMQKNEILIIEDNSTMRFGMSETLQRENYLVKDFAEPLKAMEHFSAHQNALVITDLRMDNMSGIDVLKKVKKIHPESEVIIISAYGSVETAVEAMHLGAADFITKPFSNEELRIRVKKIFDQFCQKEKMQKLEQTNLYLNEELSRSFPEIIGESPAMQSVFALIDKVAQGDSTVLIQGESGTGKELVARAIHRKSNRSGMPFVRVNCGALNDNLLESELFGHEKGAFTGAIKQRKGRFELADGGTLFLDEIGDVSSTMQVKLLRVLQEKEFERVGGEQTIKCDVRVISATNKNLQQAVSENKFREDLYYRLSVIPFVLPALRQRKEDIEVLANFFIDKLSQKNNRPKISAEVINAFKDYSWPGNIRELENLIERLLVISAEDEITLPQVIQYLGQGVSATNNYNGLALDEALARFEKGLIQHAMKQADGVKNRAAKILGVRTSALYYKLEKYGLI